MDKNEIKAKLDAEGIEYDARMSAENLAALLPVKGVVMRVERDYWPTDDDIKAGWPKNERNRVREGTLIEVDAETAMDGMEAGVLSRVKA